MKIRKIVTVLIVFLMLSSCENSQKYFDSAKEKFNTGKFEEALKDIQFVKRTNNYTLKQKATDLENRIQDTLLIINYYSMKENRNDNIYMDFLFNMKEYEVKKHANKLIKANKIKPENTYTFTIGYGEYAQKVALTGYELDFFLSDYKCTGLIKCYYFLNGLDKLEITLFNYPDAQNSSSVLSDVKNLFENKYGTPQDYSSFYTEDESEHIKYLWRESNKAIYVSQISGFVTITYQDLISKFDKSDLKQMLKEADKELNKEKSKIMENEI